MLFCTFYIEFHITYFPNGRPDLDSYNIGIEMIEKYGTHMDGAELRTSKRRMTLK